MVDILVLPMVGCNRLRRRSVCQKYSVGRKRGLIVHCSLRRVLSEIPFGRRQLHAMLKHASETKRMPYAIRVYRSRMIFLFQCNVQTVRIFRIRGSSSQKSKNKRMDGAKMRWLAPSVRNAMVGPVDQKGNGWPRRSER